MKQIGVKYMNSRMQEIDHQVKVMTYNEKAKQLGRQDYLDLNIKLIELIQTKEPDDLYILMEKYGMSRDILEFHVKNLTATKPIFESLYRKQLAENEFTFNQRQGL